MIFWSSLDVNEALIFYVNDVMIFINYYLPYKWYYTDNQKEKFDKLLG
jgi:hypothetical protein